MTDRSDGATLHVSSELTLRIAPAYAQIFRQHLDSGAKRILIDLDDVKTVDVVGLAVLLQSVALAREHGRSVSILPGSAVHQALIDARIVERLPLVQERLLAPRPEEMLPPFDERRGRHVIAARTADFVLRVPAWEDLVLFERWAADPELDRLVGSDTLYRCRYLGAYHPAFMSEVLYHPTALTLLVDSVGPNPTPLGFVRLSSIHLAHGFAFLEVGITNREALRKGWGVAASRLFVFYAWDVLQLHRIEAKVYEYNRLSMNTLRRNGFQQEGVLRKAVYAEGFHWDIVVFSILEDELREQRKRLGTPVMSLWGKGDEPVH
jgi:RimJ/RimL family protein N-acetyltransferase/ABC-type transporter Mla MlaB component